MKRDLLILILSFSLFNILRAQTANDYLEMGDSIYYDFENRNYDDAIKNYIKAIELDPSLTSAYENLANCYWFSNNYEGALNTYNALLKKIQIDTSNIRYEVYFEIGNIYSKIASTYQTKNIYFGDEYSLNKDKISKTIENKQINIKLALENYQRAWAEKTSENYGAYYYTKAPFSLFEKVGDCFAGLYKFDMAINNYTNAIEYLVKLRKQDEYLNYTRNKLWEKIGDSYSSKSETNNAVNYFKKILKEDESNIEVNGKLGDIYYQQYNYKIAKQYYELSIDLTEKELNRLKKESEYNYEYDISYYKKMIAYSYKYLGFTNLALKNYWAAQLNFISAFNYAKTKHLKNLILETTLKARISPEGWKPCLDKDDNPLMSPEKEHYYYNPKKIKRTSNSIKQAWIKIFKVNLEELTFEDNQSYVNDNTISETAMELANEELESEINLLEFNCTNEKMRTLQSVKYDANGNIVDSFFPKKENLEWYDIIPNSIGDGLYNCICVQNGKK